MKKLVFSIVVLACCGLLGCTTIMDRVFVTKYRWDPAKVPAVLPGVINISASVPLNVGGLQTAIDIDNHLVPHVLVENSPDYYIGYLREDKEWVLEKHNTFTEYNNSQMANSNIEVAKGSEGLWGYGYGYFPYNADLNIFLIKDCEDDNTFSAYKNVHIHAQNSGSASYDPYLKQWVVCSHRFQYRAFKSDGGDITQVASGGYFASSGGEKEDFYVSKAAAVAHPASGDHAMWFYATDSKLQTSLRGENNRGDVTWSDWDTYLSMWDDMSYISVRGDAVEPGTAYMAANYWSVNWTKETGEEVASDYNGIYINIWKTTNMDTGDGEFQYPNTDILCLDGAGHMHKRYPVQLAEAKFGGCFVGYTRGGHVLVKWVPSDVRDNNDKIKEFDLGAGGMSSLRVDNVGNLHVIYTGAANALYYKRVMFYAVPGKYDKVIDLVGQLPLEKEAP